MLHGVAHDLKLHKRMQKIIWCCPNTQTFVTFAVTNYANPEVIWKTLYDAYEYISGYVWAHGDSIMPTGSFRWPADSPVILEIYNANNHQTTCGVMASAIWALADWMHMNGVVGGGTFNIYDGQNQVGTGRISDV